MFEHNKHEVAPRHVSFSAGSQNLILQLHNLTLFQKAKEFSVLMYLDT